VRAVDIDFGLTFSGVAIFSDLVVELAVGVAVMMLGFLDLSAAFLAFFSAVVAGNRGECKGFSVGVAVVDFHSGFGGEFL
jgi:hypothetical protein